MRAIQRYPVATFFLLTYVFTWSLYGVVIALGIRTDSLSGIPLLILAVFAPTLSAILLTALNSGRRGVADLLRGALQWRVNIRWYVFVLAFWAVGLLLVTVVAGLVGLTPRAVDDPPLSAFPFLFLMILVIGGPIQEEFGWRGYALARLQTSRSALRASLLVGLVWGSWHIPLFWVQGTWHHDLVSGRSVPVTLFFVAFFVLLTVPLSVVYAWVYNSTGSLLLVILLHAAMNTTDTWAPWPLDQHGAMTWAAMEFAYLLAAALIVLAVAGPARLSRRSPALPAGADLSAPVGSA